MPVPGEHQQPCNEQGYEVSGKTPRSGVRKIASMRMKRNPSSAPRSERAIQQRYLGGHPGLSQDRSAGRRSTRLHSAGPRKNLRKGQTLAPMALQLASAITGEERCGISCERMPNRRVNSGRRQTLQPCFLTNRNYLADRDGSADGLRSTTIRNVPGAAWRHCQSHRSPDVVQPKENSPCATPAKAARPTEEMNCRPMSAEPTIELLRSRRRVLAGTDGGREPPDIKPVILASAAEAVEIAYGRRTGR